MYTIKEVNAVSGKAVNHASLLCQSPTFSTAQKRMDPFIGFNKYLLWALNIKAKNVSMKMIVVVYFLSLSTYVCNLYF